MRKRRYGRQARWGNRRIAAIGAAIVAVGAVGVGTGISYAGQNGQAPAAAADPNPDCSLVVPPDPLSARGLATSYALVATDPGQGACHEADAAQAAFVQATVVDPATGKVSVYNPLVIDQGTRPQVAPVTPVLPRNAVVGIWFGFNGDNLTLEKSGGSLKAGACVNGSGGSIFTQFAYCNAPAFFTAANKAIKAGRLRVPPLGTGKDGHPCPTTRDFTVVDQDQSDNVTSAYLIQGTRAAQDTAADRALLPGASVQVNGSDNLLLVQFVDQAVGCTPFEAPDLADKGALTTSLALDELQAAAEQGKPVALVPPNDPMAQVGGRTSRAKLNLYRQGVDMAPVGATNGLAASYCQELVDVAPARLQQDRALTRRVGSPDPGAATNLFTFLAQRLSASYVNLGCDNLIQNGNPVVVDVRNGVAVDASFPGAATPTASSAPPTSAPPSSAPASIAPSSSAPASSLPASRPAGSVPASRPAGGGAGGRTGPARGHGTPPATVTTSTASVTVKDAFTPNATTSAASRPPIVKPVGTVRPEPAGVGTRGSGRTESGSGSAVVSTDGASPAQAYRYSDDGAAALSPAPATAGSDAQAAGRSQSLPVTGSNSLVLIAGGVVLILAGLAVVAVIPRRRARGVYY